MGFRHLFSLLIRQFQLLCFHADWFFLLPGQVYCQSSVLNYSVQSLYFSTPKILFSSFLCFLSLCWISQFFSCIVFLISVSYLSMFSYSSLIMLKTIILNSLSGNLCISISLGAVTESLLCSFYVVVFPWFFKEYPCSLVEVSARLKKSLFLDFINRLQ